MNIPIKAVWIKSYKQVDVDAPDGFVDVINIPDEVVGGYIELITNENIKAPVGIKSDTYKDSEAHVVKFISDDGVLHTLFEEQVRVDMVEYNRLIKAKWQALSR